jgi:hypothetical protein
VSLARLRVLLWAPALMPVVPYKTKTASDLPEYLAPVAYFSLSLLAWRRVPDQRTSAASAATSQTPREELDFPAAMAPDPEEDAARPAVAPWHLATGCQRAV